MNLPTGVHEHPSGYSEVKPRFVIVAGPNGSGKSTNSRALLPDSITYINADEIAKTLAVDPNANRDMEASRLLLAQWDDLAEQRKDFAIETTLSSRSLAPRIQRLTASGYRFGLLYFWLESPDLAAARVAARVQMGGHNIPEDTIRRRYAGGLRNLIQLYLPLADTWQVYNNTVSGAPRIVAEGSQRESILIYENEIWNHIQRAGNGQ